jgi:PAS domain S-box-containing protein
MQPVAPPTYELAFASLPEPTLLIDESGRLRGANGAARSLLGAEAERAADRAEAIERVLPWLGAAVDRVLDGADEVGLEAEVATRHGWRCLGARLRRMDDGQRVLRGVVAVLEDLSEKKALEERQQAVERLEVLGSVAASLAHAVNSPLACVVAGLSFVEGEHSRLGSALGEEALGEAREALEEAREAALRVSRIVRALQDFGQAHACRDIAGELPAAALGPVLP